MLESCTHLYSLAYFPANHFWTPFLFVRSHFVCAPNVLPQTNNTTTINQYEAGFMGLAHTEEDVEKTIAAAKEVFAII